MVEENKEIKKQPVIKMKSSIKNEIIAHMKKVKKSWDIRKDENCHYSTKKVILENIESYRIALEAIEKLESEE